MINRASYRFRLSYRNLNFFRRTVGIQTYLFDIFPTTLRGSFKLMTEIIMGNRRVLSNNHRRPIRGNAVAFPVIHRKRNRGTAVALGLPDKFPDGEDDFFLIPTGLGDQKNASATNVHDLIIPRLQLSFSQPGAEKILLSNSKQGKQGSEKRSLSGTVKYRHKKPVHPL